MGSCASKLCCTVPSSQPNILHNRMLGFLLKATLGQKPEHQRSRALSDFDLSGCERGGVDTTTYAAEPPVPPCTAVSYLYSLHLTNLMAIVLICIPFGLALLLFFTSLTSIFPLFDARAFDFDDRERRCEALTMRRSRW